MTPIKETKQERAGRFADTSLESFIFPDETIENEELRGKSSYGDEDVDENWEVGDS